MITGNLSSIFGAGGFNAAAFNDICDDLPEVQFRDALAGIGIVPNEIVGDGKIHRVNGPEDKNKSAWYALFLDGDIPAGVFGDWRTGETHHWRATMGGRTLSWQEELEIQRRVADAKRLRDLEHASDQDEAAKKAEKELGSAPAASAEHPYLLRKKIQPYGLFQQNGKLLVPLVNGDGKTVRSYQSIDATGYKLFLKGGQAKGCYHLIAGDTVTIYVGEGYATCATVFEATGSSIYTAFSANNLVNVALIVRKRHPAARIVILGDNDDAGKEWATKAAQAVSGEVAMATGVDGDDFNDMGVDATRVALGINIKQGPSKEPSSVERTIEDDFSAIPQRLIDLSSVGGMLEKIQLYTLSTATIPNQAAAAIGALALVGTVLANKVQTNTGLRSNNQFVLVAGTGTGKEHPRKINKAILMMAGLTEQIGGEEIASGQGLMASAANRPTSLFQLDEFGMMLQAISSDKAGSWQKAILSALMKLHSGAGSIVAGQEKADQNSRPRVDVLYPCVTVFATTTANELVPALKSGQVVSGFANRMIFMLTKSKRQKRNMKALLTSPPPEIIDWIAAVRAYHYNLAGTTPENPVTVGMDAEATRAFEDWEDEIMSLQDKNSAHEVMYVRAWEHASKLAMIVAMSHMSVASLSSYQGCLISAEDAHWAIDLVRFSFSEMFKLIENRVADTEFEGQCKEVSRLIRAASERGMTERDLNTTSRTFRGLDGLARDKIFAVLQRNEQIRRVTIDSTGGRGRPRVAWVTIE